MARFDRNEQVVRADFRGALPKREQAKMESAGLDAARTARIGTRQAVVETEIVPRVGGQRLQNRVRQEPRRIAGDRILVLADR